MKLLTNYKLIKSFNVSKSGEITANPDVRYCGIVKSDLTAKKIVAKELGVPTSTLVVTEIAKVEQWYEIDETVFFENAVEIPAPRAKEKDEETEE